MTFKSVIFVALMRRLDRILITMIDWSRQLVVFRAPACRSRPPFPNFYPEAGRAPATMPDEGRTLTLSL